MIGYCNIENSNKSKSKLEKKIILSTAKHVAGSHKGWGLSTFGNTQNSGKALRLELRGCAADLEADLDDFFSFFSNLITVSTYEN